MKGVGLSQQLSQSYHEVVKCTLSRGEGTWCETMDGSTPVRVQATRLLR